MRNKPYSATKVGVKDRFMSQVIHYGKTIHNVVILHQQSLSQARFQSRRVFLDGAVQALFKKQKKWATLRTVDAVIGQGNLMQQFKDTS